MLINNRIMRKYHYKTAAYQAKRNARKNNNSKLVPDIKNDDSPAGGIGHNNQREVTT